MTRKPERRDSAETPSIELKPPFKGVEMRECRAAVDSSYSSQLPSHDVFKYLRPSQG